MQKKIDAGAKFFQTQAVYDIETMREFRKATKDMNCKVLAGIVTLKVAFSSKSMIFLANLYESVATHSKTLPLALKLTPVKIGRVSLSLAAKQV